MNRRTKRMAVDIAMTALLPVLMAYALVGETAHEVVGTAMLALVIVHHALNRRWYAALFKGKYRARRIFQTALDLALLTAVVLQIASGILISKHLYTFLAVSGVAARAREIHLCLAYWSLILMSAHAGMHVPPLLRPSSARRVAAAALALAAAYGCTAFMRRQIPDYLFLRTAFAFFDYSEPKLHFFIDYISMMILFGGAGHLAAGALSGKRR